LDCVKTKMYKFSRKWGVLKMEIQTLLNIILQTYTSTNEVDSNLCSKMLVARVTSLI
jgi:hypothetical protein